MGDRYYFVFNYMCFAPTISAWHAGGANLIKFNRSTKRCESNMKCKRWKTKKKKRRKRVREQLVDGEKKLDMCENGLKFKSLYCSFV